jgi:uncharacterized protein YndB with AHSA1/START domain
MPETIAQQTPTKQDLVLTRTFDTPVALVWKAWTDPDQVKRWWGPDCFTAPLAQMDVRVGGTSLVCMSSPRFGDLYNSWHYRELVPLERIEYIQNMADKDGNTVDPAGMGLPPDFPRNQRNTVTFKAITGNQTEMTVTQHDWTPGQMMDLARMGMEQCLNKMAATFAKP